MLDPLISPTVSKVMNDCWKDTPEMSFLRLIKPEKKNLLPLEF